MKASTAAMVHHSAPQISDTASIDIRGDQRSVAIGAARLAAYGASGFRNAGAELSDLAVRTAA
jgi:hypothetical protein